MTHSLCRWSVVIPAYMPGENLAITLQSVQTAFAGRDDFEVVVVDDASPEPVVLDYYGPRFRLARMSDNVGAVPNFNRAVGLAQGEYVHVLHADDYVEADFYTALEQGLMVDGVVAAACGTHRVDARGSLIETMKPEMDRAGVWPGAFERLAVSNRLPAVSIVAKRSTYDQVGGFDESLVHAADWDLWIRFSRAGDVYYDPRPMGSYRVHDEQHTASLTRSAKNIDDAIAVIHRLPQRVPNRGARPLMTRALLYRAMYAIRSAAQAARGRDTRTAAAQIVASGRCSVLAARALLFGY